VIDAAAPITSLADGRPIDLVCGAANSTHRLDGGELELYAALPATRGATGTSIKGAVGEFGAAGALTTAAACLALHEQMVPPLCHLETPSPTTLRLATRQAEPAKLHRALVSGIARGGAVTALLLEKP
jgi:3-oxoacyl-(acyl-carrier-protein) synthase